MVPDPTTRTDRDVVLVVEDEPSLRRLLEHGLAEHGWGTLVAEHAEDALGLTASHGSSIRVLVTDVVMPRMSGGALVERIRRRLPALHVVFVSGHEPDASLVAASRSAYLRKPFTIEQLDRTIRSVLDAQ